MASKRSSVREILWKSCTPLPWVSGARLSNTPRDVSPVASVISATSSQTQLPDIDLSTTDVAHIYSCYKKLPYSMAIRQSVAVDTLACNAHRSLFAILSKRALERRTFVLLPHAILRYALNASSTTVPEQVLLLSAESVAYASDDILGQQYVLRVSDRPEPHQVEEQRSTQVAPDEIILEPMKSPTTPLMAATSISSRRSLFFHVNISIPTPRHPHPHDNDSAHHNYHYYHHRRYLIPPLRNAKTMTILLVFDNVAEFMLWMSLVRSQIKLQRKSLENKHMNFLRATCMDSRIHIG
ncbi:hypothetical protein V1522DRAFT_417718 [Lipomyces starkeyi]